MHSVPMYGLVHLSHAPFLALVMQQHKKVFLEGIMVKQCGSACQLTLGHASGLLPEHPPLRNDDGSVNVVRQPTVPSQQHDQNDDHLGARGEHTCKRVRRRGYNNDASESGL